MNSSKKIARNSAILSAGHVVSKLVNLLLVLILTRHLGSDGFGSYSFGMAYVMLFMIVVHFGITTLLVRDIARDKSLAPNMVSQTFALAMLGGLLAYVLILGSALLLGIEAEEWNVLVVLGIYLVCDGWSRYFFSVFRGFEKMEYETLTLIIERLLMLVVALVAWYVDASLLELLWGFTVIQMTKCLIAIVLIRRNFFSFSPKLNIAKSKALLQEAMPFALVALFGVVTTRIDVVMLHFYHDDAAAGIYNVARRMMESAIFVPENFYGALLPAMSVLYISQRDKFATTFQRSLLYMIVLAIPLSLLLVVLAPFIVDLLFEPEFAAATVPFQWLSVVLGLFFVKYVFIAALNSSGNQGWMSLLAGSGMVLNILFNWLLIPEYSIEGAGIATFLSEFLSAILGIIILRRRIDLPKIDRRIILVLFLGAGATGIAWLLEDWHMVIQAGLPTVLFLAAVLGFKIVKPSEFKSLRG
ncbi:MAG: flippase [Calditrichota bacterium]